MAAVRKEPIPRRMRRGLRSLQRCRNSLVCGCSRRRDRSKRLWSIMLRCHRKIERAVDSMFSERNDWGSRLLRIAVCAFCLFAYLMASGKTWASEYHGRVTFGGLPVPGATIKVMHDGQTLVAVSDLEGVYSFADLADGPWKIEVAMQCFATI